MDFKKRKLKKVYLSADGAMDARIAYIAAVDQHVAAVNAFLGVDPVIYDWRPGLGLQPFIFARGENAKGEDMGEAWAYHEVMNALSNKNMWLAFVRISYDLLSLNDFKVKAALKTLSLIPKADDQMLMRIGLSIVLGAELLRFNQTKLRSIIKSELTRLKYGRSYTKKNMVRPLQRSRPMGDYPGTKTKDNRGDDVFDEESDVEEVDNPRLGKRRPKKRSRATFEELDDVMQTDRSYRHESTSKRNKRFKRSTSKKRLSFSSRDKWNANARGSEFAKHNAAVLKDIIG